MTVVKSCSTEECKYYVEGNCTLKEITINDDWQCEKGEEGE